MRCHSGWRASSSTTFSVFAGRAPYNDYTYVRASKVAQTRSPRVRANGLLNRAIQREAKEAVAAELARLLVLPSSASFSSEGARSDPCIAGAGDLGPSTGIAPPLVPPRTRSQGWPNMLSRGEKYLGTVKKVADYGAFVSLPAGADGLVRSSSAMSTFARDNS